jgi:hypothetical protein
MNISLYIPLYIYIYTHMYYYILMSTYTFLCIIYIHIYIGIGDEKAATTAPVNHNGRYFDRLLRFEDSCYALCPPTSMMKPSFVFILELFHIASFNNPSDKVLYMYIYVCILQSMYIYMCIYIYIHQWLNLYTYFLIQVVAWAALPMCNEHLAITHGKFKLPFFKGIQM